MKKNIYSVISALFLTIGFIFLFNSVSTITGYAIAQDVTPTSSTIFSIYFFAGATWFNYLANRRKGQAATEFVMTYGWAIIIIILILAILVYLGIFSSKRTCDNIILTPPFVSTGTAYTNGEFAIQVTNTAPANILVTELEVGSCSSTINRGVNYGDSVLLSVPCPLAKNEDKISINYIIDGTSLVQSSDGKVCLLEGDIGGSYSPPEVCGNGIIEPSSGEQCDDNNINTGDGCNDLCEVEPGYFCSGEPSVCTYTACCELPEILIYEECIAAGKEWYCPVPVCGNNIIEDGEECDDGGTEGGDGCSSTCTLEVECNDLIDNDADGRIDFPEDPECESLQGLSETGGG